MKKLHFSIIIDAPREKVWQTMLADETYRKWTEAFYPGSHFVGSWETGSEIRFLAPNSKGNMEGMVSRIEENRPYEFMSIEHLGMIEDGKEDTTSEKVKDWAGAHENYTFKEMDGKTELLVDLDSAEEYADMFKGMWPKALGELKKLIEK